MRRIIRKFAQNKQTNTQTNKHTNKQTEISNTEATLIPCGSLGGAGQYNKKDTDLGNRNTTRLLTQYDEYQHNSINFSHLVQRE